MADRFIDGDEEGALLSGDELEKLEQMRNALLAELEDQQGGGGGEEEEEEGEEEENYFEEEEEEEEDFLEVGSVGEEGRRRVGKDCCDEAMETGREEEEEMEMVDIDVNLGAENVKNQNQDAGFTTTNIVKTIEESEAGNELGGGCEEVEDEEEEGGGSNSEEEEEEQFLEGINNEHVDSLLEGPVEGGDKSGMCPNRQKQLTKKFKRVLEYRATDHFNVLPDGWVEITHASGLPVYLHKPSRVCTFGRPYFIGRCSIRNHKVPESAIPCLFQKKYQDEVEATLLNSNKNQKQQETSEILDVATCSKGGTGEGENKKSENFDAKNNNFIDKLGTPSVHVKTELDHRKSQLNADQLHEYAKSRFKFKNICVYRFGKWTEARSFYKRKKMRKILLGNGMERGGGGASAESTLGTSTTVGGMALEKRVASREERPGLPTGVKLITVPSLELDSKPNKRLFYLNPQGKTSVSILHEFVQKALKSTVRYFFSETRSSATPYHCSVKLVLNTSTTPHSQGGRTGGRGGRHHQRQQYQQLQRPSAEIIRQKLAQIHDFNKTNALQQQRMQFGGEGFSERTVNNSSECTQSNACSSSDSTNNACVDGSASNNLAVEESCSTINATSVASGSASNSDSQHEFVTLGEGFGAGKKQAKVLAAKAAIEKLVPGIEFDADGIAISGKNATTREEAKGDAENTEDNSETAANSSTPAAAVSLGKAKEGEDVEHIFDMIGVTDTRIPELCARAGQPSPYIVLQEYLKRYSAFGDTEIKFTSRWIRHQRHEFKLSIGEEHCVKVVSGNKRDGKQIAAQSMLKKLHPEVETWGAILKLYGYEAQQKFREARKSKDSVVKLQGVSDETNVRHFQPNNLILEKLRSEMLKLSEGLIRDEKKHLQQEASVSKVQIEAREKLPSPPPAKLRRCDFRSELPVLSDEQLRELSAKFATERPELQKCMPSVRF